jgi:type I restriction enzyme S subunit
MAGKVRETVYGDFAAEFVEERLANLCDPDAGIQTGPFGSQLHQEDYVTSGTPIITVEHLGQNSILHEGVPRVSDADRNRLSRYSLCTGDIVFSRVGSVDRRALVKCAEDGWLFSGRCLRVRPNAEKIDSGFLSYFFGLPAFKEYIRAIAVGATMPSLNTSILSEVVVLHPRSIGEQRAIARILGALDDKIELNRRMNETLEAMARVLFKSWFVDFDPVRAKTAGREQRGLASDIAGLFPDAFDQDEMPLGWHLGQLSDIASVVMGASPPGETYNELGIGVPLVNGPVEYGDFFVEKKKWTTQPTRLSCKGDLILCVRGSTTGRHAFSDDEYCLGGGVCAIRAIRSEQALVNRLVLDGLPELLSKTTGSVFPNLSSEDIKSLRVVIPPLPIAKLFCNLIAPADQRVWNNVSESRTLSMLRDTLLPRLISGGVRVKDAERVVAEVAG